MYEIEIICRNRTIAKIYGFLFSSGHEFFVCVPTEKAFGGLRETYMREI